MGKYKAWILLVFCNLFWAGNFVFGKYVISEMTPLWITFSRWVLALFLLFPIAQILEKPDWKQAAKAWFPLTIMGIMGVIGYNMFLYSALAYTSATNAALVSALNPGVIVLFSVIMLREKISRIQAGGFVISLIGVFVILTRGNLGQLLQMDYNRGDLLMIGSVIVWTFYSIIGKKLAHIPAVTTTAISTFLSMLILAPFAIVQGIDLNKIGSMSVVGILYMVIFASVCSFVFWNMSVRAVGASQAGIFLNLIPVFTALISLILGESITGSQILGGLLVFIGVYITTGLLDRKITEMKQSQISKSEE